MPRYAKYLVRFNDGRDDEKAREIEAASPQDAAERYCDEEYFSGNNQSEYDIVILLDGQRWEATVEAQVQFDVFITCED